MDFSVGVRLFFNILVFPTKISIHPQTDSDGGGGGDSWIWVPRDPIKGTGHEHFKSLA